LIIGRIALVVLLLTAVAACGHFAPVEEPLWQKPHAHPIGSTRVAFSPDSMLLASGGYRGTVMIWRLPEGDPVQSYGGHAQAVRGLVWLNNRLLASGGEDGLLAVRDVASGRMVRSKPVGAAITTLALLSAKEILICGREDGAVSAYRADSLDEIGAYDTGAPVLSVAVARNGERIGVSSRGGRVLLLDPELRLVDELSPPPQDALELAFSPTGEQLAGGAWLKLFFWELPADELRVVASCHWGAAVSVDYTPEGALASIGRHTDAKVCIADVADGRVLRRLRPQDLCGAAVRVSPDGRYLATASDDESVRLFALGD